MKPLNRKRAPRLAIAAPRSEALCERLNQEEECKGCCWRGSRETDKSAVCLSSLGTLFGPEMSQTVAESSEPFQQRSRLPHYSRIRGKGSRQVSDGRRMNYFHGRDGADQSHTMSPLHTPVRLFLSLTGTKYRPIKSPPGKELMCSP